MLHGSESLCKLLRYLAEHALDHPGSSLKEYQIATEVFGRSPNFDPQSDSTIRVQAGRLRLKIAEYYASEGAEDPIQVEMPKGTYVVSFHRREGSAAKLRAVAQSAQHEEMWPRSGLAASGSLPFWFCWQPWWYSWQRPPISLRGDRANDRGAEPVPAAFKTFWKAFVSGPEEPWVIFSNGAFVGRPETGMRYFDPARDSRDQILEHYTGVGEVLAIHALDHTFGLLHRQLRVKRGSLLSLDDVKNNDTIFVGSPAENLTLRDIPSTHDFVFRTLDSRSAQR